MESKIERIEKLQVILNSKEFVSPEYFIPNSLGFRRLVCVNHITALLLSKNYGPIPSLIKISRTALCEQPEIDGFNKFSECALKYLALVEEFVSEIVA